MSAGNTPLSVANSVRKQEVPPSSNCLSSDQRTGETLGVLATVIELWELIQPVQKAIDNIGTSAGTCPCSTKAFSLSLISISAKTFWACVRNLADSSIGQIVAHQFNCVLFPLAVQRRQSTAIGFVQQTVPEGSTQFVLCVELINWISADIDTRRPISPKTDDNRFFIAQDLQVRLAQQARLLRPTNLPDRVQFEPSQISPNRTYLILSETRSDVQVHCWTSSERLARSRSEMS